MRRDRLGEFEELVLLATYGLGGNAYGITIRRSLRRSTERSVSLGAVYSALHRLELKGYLRSRMGDATPSRGGRRKRLFDVTESGLATLREVRRLRERMWREIDAGAPAGGTP